MTRYKNTKATECVEIANDSIIDNVEVETPTVYTYIKKEIPGYYFRPTEPLTEDNCDKLGFTWEDFEEGMFVPLNEEQITFSEEHPNASIKEIFDTKLEEVVIPERTIERAKAEKLREINNYDNSRQVNMFTINDEEIVWFTPTERANYKASIESAKLLGIPTLKFFVNDKLFEVETSKAEMMLAAIQLYADECYIITKQHQITVENLETIEEVDSYDYTVGYPNKLNFDII